MSQHAPIILATANPHKAVEIQDIMVGYELLPRPVEVPEVVEDGETLEDNARLKARALVAATGLPAVADDTGLFVEALDGRPGIYAARYAGEDATYDDNVQKLLRELGNSQNRAAHFVTVALLAYPDGSEVSAVGRVDGHIALAPRGIEGMGYDPVFAPDGFDGRTFAELGMEEKARISHRAHAFSSLMTMIGK